MVMMQKVKGAFAALAVVACTSFGQAAFAQQAPPAQGNTQSAEKQDFSDAELKQFVQASAKAMEIQEQSQKTMVAVLEEEKLSVEKFTQMAQAHQQQKLDDVKATPEELTAFNKVAQKFMEMQPKIEQDLQQAVKDTGISLEKFEQIMIAYQENPAIQAKVQKLAEEQQ